MSELRSSLRWLLLGSTGLSILALAWPEHAASPVVAVAARTEILDAAPGEQQPSMRSSGLPPQLPPHPLDKSGFDPFASVQPPPTVALAAPALKPFVGPLYVPPPVAPTLNYRYLGQMTDPSGQRLVYLAGPAKEIAVTTGTRLDEGYVVESVTTDAVRLHYPPLDARAVIPLPASADVATAPSAVAQR